MEFKERITIDLGLKVYRGEVVAKSSPIEGLKDRVSQETILIMAKNGTEAMELLHSWLLAEGQTPERCSLSVRREIMIANKDATVLVW